MIYVIQTNTSLDNLDNPKDFQSVVFPYQSWGKYKKDLLEENAIHEIIHGTMMGNIKARCCKIQKVIIDDDHHIEIIVDNGYVKTNIKAYKVEKDRMSYACRKVLT